MPAKRMQSTTANLLGCVLISFLLASSTFAEVLYVSPVGNDLNSGQEASPVKTISRAVALAKTTDAVILLAKGTYSEASTIAIANKSFSFASASGQSDVIVAVPADKLSTFSFASSNVSLSNITLNGEGGGKACIVVSSSILNLTGSDLHNCTASDSYGAAIWSFGNSSIEAVNCNFAGNRAQFHGGAVYLTYGRLNLTNCSFTNNSAVLEGGAVFVDNANATLLLCLFANNTAYWGGALYFGDQSNVTVNSTFFFNNTAHQGGAVQAWSSLTNITNSSFVNNSASGSGGAIFLQGGVANLTLSWFFNNTAHLGGAISGDSGNALHVNGTWFVNNSAALQGGAIFNAFRCLAHINGSAFINNTARQYHAGAIYNKYGAVLSVNSTAFINNSAAVAAGAIYNEVGNVTVRSSSFVNNSAQSGGGVYVFDGFTSFDNCELFNNRALLNGGGAYFAAGASIWTSIKFDQNHAEGEDDTFVLVADAFSCSSCHFNTATATQSSPVSSTHFQPSSAATGSQSSPFVSSTHFQPSSAATGSQSSPFVSSTGHFQHSSTQETSTGTFSGFTPSTSYNFGSTTWYFFDEFDDNSGFVIAVVLPIAIVTAILFWCLRSRQRSEQTNGDVVVSLKNEFEA